MWNKFNEYFEKNDKKYWESVLKDDGLGLKLRFKLTDVLKIYKEVLKPPNHEIYEKMDMKDYDKMFYEKLYSIEFYRKDDKVESKMEQLISI